MPQIPVPRPIRRREVLKHALALAGLSLVPCPLRAEEAPLPYVDGLSFLPERVGDVARSGLAAFILDCSQGVMLEDADGKPRYYRSYAACRKSIRQTRRRLRKHSDVLFLATRGSDVAEATASGRTAVFLQFQSSEPLEGRLSHLDFFYRRGLRVLQLTHHFNNVFAGGALEREPRGLTKLGHALVERMNELGVVPDVAHGSDATALDVAGTSRRPVILSHGGARALVRSARCAPDRVIRALADTGGVMGIFMMTFWLTTDPQPRLEHLVRQIRHVADVGGIEAVGIANDYAVTGDAFLAELGNDNAEGVKAYYPWWESIRERGVFGFDELPRHVVFPELNDVRRMFTIHEALEKSGMKPAAIEKVMGGNWIRVLTETLS